MNAVTFAILTPLVAATLCMLTLRSGVAQRLFGVGGMAVLLLVAVRLMSEVADGSVLVVRFGDWPAPFGIVLVGDLLSGIMVLVSAIIGLAVAVYSLADIDARRERFGYYTFLHFMMLGVCGSFLTGDIFNMFVWFEVMLISSFVLMSLGGERPQMEGAVKYVTLNLISSSLFLAACGILYGQTGTLNMADLAVRSREYMRPELLTMTAMLFLVAFGLKAAMFPLFFWLPASYHTPPVAVSAVFAGLLTKVGVYALIRTFTLIFTNDVVFTHGLLLGLAGATMIAGVLGAMIQFDFRRLLSFHIVSQIGYMVLGLALFTPLAVAATVFYIFHHIVVKANLFLISGITARYGGTFDLKKLGGFYAALPLLALLFFIPAMSLGGIPPLSGFFAKFGIVKAGLAGDTVFGGWAVVLAVVALAVGLLTLFSMTKIWAEVFWKAPTEGHVPHGGAIPAGEKFLLFAPVAALAALTLAISFFPQYFFDFAARAAEQLLHPETYIKAVLEPVP
ncbi:MAG: Na+/H+ antiporter subunit D [Chthoniobacterales bacterium]|nr:Na+/H+ antiporter subunit D [Chthoniobacterales bacterium]